MPLSMTASPVASQALVTCGMIPKGRRTSRSPRNPEIFGPARDPQRLYETGLGRNISVHAVDREGESFVAGRSAPRGILFSAGRARATLSAFWTFNPGLRQVQNEHVWPTAWSDIIPAG